jgi:ribonuclease HI
MLFWLVRLFRKALEYFKRSRPFEIYTDGSHKNGYGSWAYVVTQSGECIYSSSKRVRRASSNAMEFQAAIEALSSIPENSSCSLFSDSRILVDAMKFGICPRGYQDQFDLLKSLNEKHNIQWQWIKAHSGNKFNERCDELCILARSN